MKKIALMLLMLVVSAMAHAQSSLVATLSHEGEISTFYTPNALIEALDAATDGDIITLSSGSFTATNITKNVTIRGAGMILEDNPTIIMGKFTVDVASKEAHSLVMEGLYFSEKVTLKIASKPQFVKCCFDQGVSKTTGSGSYVEGSIFLHSILNHDVYLPSSKNYVFSGSFMNCVIASDQMSLFLSDCQVYNSIITWESNLNAEGVNLSNCIISGGYHNSYLDNKNVASNCIYVGEATGFFRFQSSKTNKSYEVDTPVFKEDGEIYELLDDLKTTWLGSDGTQVGIYGGSNPFDPTTTNPRITKFNVANKTTADGKLPVEIEVTVK